MNLKYTIITEHIRTEDIHNDTLSHTVTHTQPRQSYAGCSLPASSSASASARIVHITPLPSQVSFTVNPMPGTHGARPAKANSSAGLSGPSAILGAAVPAIGWECDSDGNAISCVMGCPRNAAISDSGADMAVQRSLSVERLVLNLARASTCTTRTPKSTLKTH